MTPQLPHKAQQDENRWLAPLLPSILAAVSLIATIDSASLAAAAERQVIEEGSMVQDMSAWNGATSNILPFTITVERDIFGGLVPSLVLEVSPCMKSAESPGAIRLSRRLPQSVLV